MRAWRPPLSLTNGEGESLVADHIGASGASRTMSSFDPTGALDASGPCGSPCRRSIPRARDTPALACFDPVGAAGDIAVVVRPTEPGRLSWFAPDRAGRPSWFAPDPPGGVSWLAPER